MGAPQNGGAQNCTNQGGCGTVFEVSTKDNFEPTLYDFTGASGDTPGAGVIEDSKGNLYGVTSFGGPTGDSLVFKLSPMGVETSFSRANFANGTKPLGGLISDAAGNLYGTTNIGGNAADCCGVVYKIDPTGSYTVLYTFPGAPNGGSNSRGGHFIDSASNLYGTTFSGGNDVDTATGTVFKLNPAGNETTLFGFTCGFDGCPDGANLQSGLIGDPAGNGVTSGGGAQDQGFVYKVESGGEFQRAIQLHRRSGRSSSERKAHSGSDHGQPVGTAANGGNAPEVCVNGCGVIFKINPSS